MSPVIDMFGSPVVIGSLVVYTTNSRDSGLTHGRVEDIYEVDSGYSRKMTKVKIRPVNRDGSTIYQKSFFLKAPGEYETVETDRPVRTSTVDYSAGKILVLN